MREHTAVTGENHVCVCVCVCVCVWDLDESTKFISLTFLTVSKLLVRLLMSTLYLILQIYKLLLYLFLLEHAVNNNAVTFQARSHVNTKSAC